MGFPKPIQNYFVASRIEYLPAVLVGFWIGIFYAARDLLSILAIPSVLYIVEGLVTFILLFNLGFLVNTKSDWLTDRLYKSHLYRTVKYFGPRFTPIILVHGVAALILCAHLALVLARPEILILLIFGWLFGLGYSLEPLHFKRRSSLHFLVGIAIFLIPGLFSYSLISPFLPGSEFYLFILTTVGITVAHYGLILFEQSADYPEDKKTNLKTLAVALGMAKTLRASVYMNLAGSVLIIIPLLFVFYNLNVLLLVYIPFLIIGRYGSFSEIFRMEKGFAELDEKKQICEIREKMKRYTSWHAAGLLSVLIACLLILIAKSVSL